MKKIASSALLSFCICASSFAQGSLTPPAAPTPTMKTLDQVEARFIINATNTPGDSTNVFRITVSGSYYLTGNITGVSGKNGIQIDADDVSLDLNGFALLGVGGTSSGVVVSNIRRNLRIYNGVVKNWQSYGIDAKKDNSNHADHSQFDHLRLSNNTNGGIRCNNHNALTDVSAQFGTNGISTGQACRLFSCTATGCGSAGFSLGGESVISASNASFNTGAGISTSPACTIIGCTAGENQSAGITTSSNCVIKNCTVYTNQGAGISTFTGSSVIDCVAGNNGFNGNVGGISAANHCTVIHCTAEENYGPGIAVTGDSLAQENESAKNTGDGIKATGDVNRIDGNHTNYNGGYGINAGNDWVVRNTSGANTAGNFNPMTGPDIGPVQTASTATNPFANLQ